MIEHRQKMEGQWTITVKLRIVVSDCLKKERKKNDDDQVN